MKISTKEQQRAEFLLQSQRIQLHQIESFSFMERYPRQAHKDIPAGKAKYGPGIFVFHLKEKQDKVIYMPPFRHPSSLVRFLVSQGVPFANLCSARTEHGNSPGGNLPASLAVYVLVLHIIPYVPDIGLLFRRHRCMVGIHSGHPVLRTEPFLHLHADDPVLLPDAGQREPHRTQCRQDNPLSVYRPAQGQLRFCPGTDFHPHHGIARQGLPLPSFLHRPGFKEKAE